MKHNLFFCLFSGLTTLDCLVILAGLLAGLAGQGLIIR